MRILAIEPYAAASHLAFLEGYAAHSQHAIELVTMPARHWKWRMRTASLALYQRVLRGASGGAPFDALFVSDYLNLAELLALLPAHLRALPTVVYFHENQLTYPLRPQERRDVHHGLVNVHSALAAGRVVFNSAYHRRVFAAAAEELLEQAPGVDAPALIARLEAKSHVTPLGCELERGSPRSLAEGQPPVLLWSHRWEYDKAPELFAAALDELTRRGFDFRLRLLGQRFRELSAALGAIEERHASRLLESGHAPTRAAYLEALDKSHLVVSTARHEFFGLATLEALRRGLLPVLPDDLAYPELLPEALARPPLLFDARRDPATIADAILAATDMLRGPSEPLEQLIETTERYCWSRVARELDAHLEALTS